MLTFAFYKAPGRLTDRVVRIADFRLDDFVPVAAPYSHCEFVLYEKAGNLITTSASKRDGNVVRTAIFTRVKGHWDTVSIEGDREAARKKSIALKDERYNTLGAALSVTPWPWRVGKGVHCSDFCAQVAHAGGCEFYDPHQLTPYEFFCGLIRQGGRLKIG